MIARDKVIKGLKHCGQPTECVGCPYDSLTGGCFTKLKADALELLEPIEPIEERLNDIDCVYRCGNCKTHFYYIRQKYCAICGRMAKWND